MKIRQGALGTEKKAKVTATIKSRAPKAFQNVSSRRERGSRPAAATARKIAPAPVMISPQPADGAKGADNLSWPKRIRKKTPPSRSVLTPISAASGRDSRALRKLGHIYQPASQDATTTVKASTGVGIAPRIPGANPPKAVIVKIKAAHRAATAHIMIFARSRICASPTSTITSIVNIADSARAAIIFNVSCSPTMILSIIISYTKTKTTKPKNITNRAPIKINNFFLKALSASFLVRYTSAA